MEYRIISQNRMYDCPYSGTILCVDNYSSVDKKYPVKAYTPDGNQFVLGLYESVEKAKDVLCDIRTGYSKFVLNCEIPWFEMPKD